VFLFSLVEVLNKFLAVYITGYLARVLPQHELGVYFSGMVILGYALELALFGSQNRHNADYAVSADYLGSTKFVARKTITIATTIVAGIFLLTALRSVWPHFDVTPLFLILCYVPLTFDYIAYGAKAVRLIVLARLISQLLAVGWMYTVAKGVIDPNYLYWGWFIQSTSLTFVVIAGVMYIKRLTLQKLVLGVTRFPVRFADIRAAFLDQGVAFALRVLALALVSGELLYLNYFSDPTSSSVATSLRLVQVLLPFVAFYVDSRVAALTWAKLEVFSAVLLLLNVGMLLLAPVLVVILYGKGYATEIERIMSLLPAFIVLSILQYSILLALRQGVERALLFRLLPPIVFSLVCLLVLRHDVSIQTIALVYGMKAVLFVLVLPNLTNKTRVLGCLAVVLPMIANPLLESAGYYAAASRFLLGLVP
jgi:O-antigen/teichoic acid export membrane protein